MQVQDFIKQYETLSSFPGIKKRGFKIAWYESQGSVQGIKALGFLCSSPNKEADELGLHKDGRSRRGVPPGYRPVDNAKKRGIKAIPKRQKRLSMRTM